MKKNETVKNVTVKFSDIQKIGNTTYGGDNNYTHIICNGDTFALDNILLRSILAIKGFKILSTSDYWWTDVDGKEHCDIDFETNMPWPLYLMMFSK